MSAKPSRKEPESISREVLRADAVFRPHQPGAIKLTRKYGDRLLAVRYRYDRQRKVRLITVELIEEEVEWTPRPSRPSRKDKEEVFVQILWEEQEKYLEVKNAGGIWDPGKKRWRLARGIAVALGLAGRIEAIPRAPTR